MCQRPVAEAAGTLILLLVPAVSRQPLKALLLLAEVLLQAGHLQVPVLPVTIGCRTAAVGVWLMGEAVLPPPAGDQPLLSLHLLPQLQQLLHLRQVSLHLLPAHQLNRRLRLPPEINPIIVILLCHLQQLTSVWLLQM